MSDLVIGMIVPAEWVWEGTTIVVNIVNSAVDWPLLLHTLTDRDKSWSGWPLDVPTHVTWIWPPFDLWPRYKGQCEIWRVHILRIVKIQVLLVKQQHLYLAKKLFNYTIAYFFIILSTATTTQLVAVYYERSFRVWYPLHYMTCLGKTGNKSQSRSVWFYLFRSWNQYD